MAAFEKDTNGKVIFTDGRGEVHGIDPSANVLSPAQADFIFINDRANPTAGASTLAVKWADVTAPANPTGTRAALVRLLVQGFFNAPSGGTVDVNVLNDPLNTKVQQFGEDVDQYNPFLTDGKAVTVNDVDLANSDFTGWGGGAVADLFKSPFSSPSLVNAAGGNPKVLEVAFKNTLGTFAVGLGENNGGDFSNVKIEGVGSGGFVRSLADFSSDGTKRTSLNVPFQANVFNKIRISFATGDPVSLSNLTIQKLAFTNSQLNGVTPLGASRSVGVTAFGELLIQLNRDLFGNLPVAEQFSLHDNSRVFGDSIALFWTDLLIGAGSNTYVKAESKNVLAVTSAGDVAATQLKHRKKYQPLKAHKTATSGLFTQQLGVEKYVGLFDLDNYGDPVVDGTIYNGVPIKITEDNVFVQIWNNGALAIEVQKSDWNIDSLDGAGSSGITLDLSYAQILISEIEWLGVGSALFIVNVDGQNVPVHRIDNANVRVQGVYMRTANLPVCYMLKSVGGAGSVDVICNAVVSGGGHNPVGVPFVIENPNTLSIGGGDYEAILFIRLKPNSYEGTVDLKGISGLVASSGDSVFRLLFNPAWGGGALTWVDYPNSHVQYAFANGNDITGEGRKVGLDYVSSDSDAGAKVVESDLRLGKTLQADANQEGRYDILCLAAQSFAGNEVYYGAISGNDIF